MRRLPYNLLAWAKMKYLLFIVLFLFTRYGTAASKMDSDSVVFKTYAMTHIQPMPDFSSIQSVYAFWQLQDKSEDKNSQHFLWWYPHDESFANGYFPTAGITHFSHPLEEPAYNEALGYLRQQFKSRMKDADSIQNEKAQLVQSLTAMDSLLHNKPLLFQIIYKDYGGNIKRYVDDLYAKSFMTSPRRFKRMMRRMRPKLLVKDLGVNYTLSMALYEVWLMQQKNTDSIKE